MNGRTFSVRLLALNDDDSGPEPGNDTSNDSKPGDTVPGEASPELNVPDKEAWTRNENSVDPSATNGELDRGGIDLHFENGIPVFTNGGLKTPDEVTSEHTNDDARDIPGHIVDHDPSNPEKSGGRHDGNAGAVPYGANITAGHYTAGSAFGGGIGAAYFLGAAVTMQVSAEVGANNNGGASVSGFLAPFGMGGFVSLKGSNPMFNWTWQSSGPAIAPGQASTKLSFGCGRSVLLVVPFLMLQLTESGWGDTNVIDASLTGGPTTIGLGLFAGVQCGGTWRPLPAQNATVHGLP